jgi:predicted nucleic acid-binding protein
MNVIVDTTVWSKYFRRKDHEMNRAVVREVSRLIENGMIIIVGPVRQELLSGISNKGVFEKLKTKLRAFEDYRPKTIDHETAAEYHNECMKRGIQGSPTDFLICAVAVRNKLAIYTEDQDFLHYKKYLPIKLHKTA